MLVRRWLRSLGIATLLVVLAAVPTARADIGDVVGTRFEEAVTYLHELDVLHGRPEGFMPLATITRAEAAKIIVEIIGEGDTAELLAGAVPFPDVGGDHWASGYIAVAKNRGIIDGFPDGSFRAGDPVTYAQYAKMLVEAAGLQRKAGYAWPANYVLAAQEAGMLADTGFSADAQAIRGDCAMMTATTVREVRHPVTHRTLAQSVFGQLSIAEVQLSPSGLTVSTGTPVEFTAVALDEEGEVVPDAEIAFSTSDTERSIISAAGRFVATQPGAFTVTASVGEIAATATIHVYGKPAQLRATASPSSVTANGRATTTITVEVLDSRGARVPAAANLIAIAHQKDSGAVTLPEVTTVEAQNGLATFRVTAGLLAEVTDTLVFTSSGLSPATATVKTVEPQPRSLRLAAEPTQLPANEMMYGQVVAEVLDQTGEPMLFGTYYVTFSISGPGYLEGGTEPVTVGTLDQRATVQVSSLPGRTGSIRITASATGLSSRSVTVSTYIAGEPRSLKVTSVDTSGEVGELNDMKIIVSVADSSGRPAIVEETITAELVADDEAGLVGLGNIVFMPGESYRTVEFYGTRAGTHRVTVRDRNRSSPAVTQTTFSCTVAAGAVSAIGIQPTGDPVVYIPSSDPRINLTAQLRDAYGNDVARSGVKLQFSASGGSASWSVAKGQVTTDSRGRAEITMNASRTSGTRYTVRVDADLDNDGKYDDAYGVTATYGIRVTNRLPSDLSIAFTDPEGAAIGWLEADASREARLRVKVLDGDGVPIATAGFDVELVLGNAGRHVREVRLVSGSSLKDLGQGVYRAATNSSGEVVFSFCGGLQGSFAVTARCLNVSPVAARNSSFRTTPGRVIADALVLKTDDTPATAIQFRKDRTVGLRVALVDGGGNRVPAPGETTLILDPSADGQYRLLASGPAVVQVELAKGVDYRAVHYINDFDGTADLSQDVDTYIAYSLALERTGNRVQATVTAADGSPVAGVTVRLKQGSKVVSGATDRYGIFSTIEFPTGPVEGTLVDACNKVGGVLQEVTARTP